MENVSSRLNKSNYMEVEPGEVVVFPTAAKHAIGSHINAIPANLPANLKDPDLTMIEHGGVHDQVRLICGWLTMDQHLFDPMFDALPDMFKIDIRERPSGQWLESSIEQAVAMSQGSGFGEPEKTGRAVIYRSCAGIFRSAAGVAKRLVGRDAGPGRRPGYPAYS